MAQGDKPPQGDAALPAELAVTARLVEGARPAEGPLLFRVEQLVAERYRIVKFLGRGATGEVYEAADAQLGGEGVALKAIRPEIALDGRAVERFRREVQLARKVTHPNVCRAFDLGHHRDGEGARATAVVFLTMELLRGETLAARLERCGRLGPTEALPLLVQMAGALDAAHGREVVHRDFKCENVLLVGEGPQTRAVVTDFGLARAMESPLSTMSGGALVGTPMYMAPEQVDGSAAGPAADVFAFGVVMYRMLTGTYPFSGDTALAVALARCRVDAPSPRAVVPELDERWERCIRRCLARQPAARFPSAGAVVAALRGEGEVGGEAPPRRGARWRRPALVAASALALAGAGGGIATWQIGRRGPAPGPPVVGTPAPVVARTAGAKARPSVAILGLRNLSGRAEVDWLSTALAELLATELGASPALRVVPGETVARLKLELALPAAESYAPETLARLRAGLGADAVVVGGFLAVNVRDPVRVDLRLQDVASGETRATVAEEARAEDLPDLVARAAARLREQLGAGAAGAGRADAPRAARPANLEAARLYALGLERLRAFDLLPARDLLERAVAADPDFPPSRTALAEVLQTLGDEERARAQSEEAFRRADRLPREDRLVVEERYRELAGQKDKAVAIARHLFELNADSVEYGRRLAEVQLAAGDAKGALATIEALRKVPGAADDPRLDWSEAECASELADYRRARQAASRAVAKARAGGLRIIVAGALELEGWAALNLGDPQAAAAAFEESTRIYAAAGHKLQLASALNAHSTVLRLRGDLRGALAKLEEGLRIVDEHAYQAGRLLFGLNLASTALLAGELGRAEVVFARTRALAAAAKDRDGEARILLGLATIRWHRGDLAGARQLAAPALAIARALPDRRPLASLEWLLGEVHAARGERGEARQRHQASLAIRTELEQAALMAESRVALSRLAVDEGRTEAGLALADQALAEAVREKTPDLLALARGARAEALLAAGRADEAMGEAERARALAGPSERAGVRLGVGVGAARVQGLGGSAEARRALDELTADAKQLGFVVEVMAAQLAAAEVELRRRPAEGLARLAAVEREARRAGLAAVAGRAAAQRGSRRSLRSPGMP